MGVGRTRGKEAEPEEDDEDEDEKEGVNEVVKEGDVVLGAGDEYRESHSHGGAVAVVVALLVEDDEVE